MPVTIDWKEILLRLAMTILGGLVIGMNREEHGRPAGVRTTLLVCLAASVAMLQANLLIGTVGKAQNSFVVLDLMRLPLGILSGMGFIGAGTILRKGTLVVGITTAATLWFATVMGLCFGGGQIGLGLAALAIGWGVLRGLKLLEDNMAHDVRGTLNLNLVGSAPTDTQLRDQIQTAGCSIIHWAVAYDRDSASRQISCELQWKPPHHTPLPPPLVETMAANPAITRVAWRPQGVATGFPESESE